MGDRADGADPDEWRRVRRYLNGHRYELTRAADGLYPSLDRVGPTPLLCPAGWIPAEPVSLGDVTLTWDAEVPPPRVDGTEPQARATRPEGPGWPRFTDYADALAALDPPRLFENRMCYRLMDVAVGDGTLSLAFGAGTYFAGLNVGEAVAHEFAAWNTRGTAGLDTGSGTVTGSGGVARPAAPRLADLPLRDLVGNPADLMGRCVNPAISMLTLRVDRDGAMSFLLHHRDPARVAHGGGLYQVIPVGVFQPSNDSPAALHEDFDLWRCAVREYGEELLGLPESYGDGAFDYGAWPLYQALSRARRDGSLASYVLGIGVDPLSLATDVLAVTVIGAEVFDDLFGAMVASNAEGSVLREGPREGPRDGARGLAFTQDSIERFVTREPMQAAGAAALWLAWRHRDLLTAASSLNLSPCCRKATAGRDAPGTAEM